MNSIKGAGLVSFYHRVALRLVQENSLGRAHGTVAGRRAGAFLSRAPVGTLSGSASRG